MAAVCLSARDRPADARARRAAAERRRLNSLNYGDLLNLTARVLRENVGVRRRCSRSIGICSSTSSRTPIRSRPRSCSGSRKTGGKSAGRRPGAADADWRKVPLRPGALFVVGDPKQSIYRFRRADIDIYNIVRAALQRARHRARAAADDELPVGAPAVQLGERGIRDAVPGGADRPRAPVCLPRCRIETTEASGAARSSR